MLITGGTIVTMSSKGVLKDGAVAIEDEYIIDVGKSRELRRKYRRYEVINAERKVVIPGLISTHHHAAMSLLRGYADDYPLKEWLERWIWPLEKCMNGRDIYIGALLTAVESIMGGEALAREWHGKHDGRIRVSVDPHAPYTVDPEYMVELRHVQKDLNERYGSPDNPVIWHIHVAETEDEPDKIREAFKTEVKGGVVEYLDSLGVLGRDVIAAHCVALNERDITILRDRGVKVSHCPISNLKLASGVSPVPRLLDAGVTVSLGTDGPSSNNASDMFEVMKVAALLHKGVWRNPTLLPAEKVLGMATREGAKALLWEREIGSIETGKKADIAILNFDKPHLCPLYNELSHLVYVAKASDVETVIINGEVVMENREVKTVNVPRLMECSTPHGGG